MHHLDHSIACAHGSQHVASASKRRGAHITAVEAIKVAKYSEEYRRNWGAKFYPVVLDTNGGWGKGVNEYSQTIQHIIKVNALLTPKPRSYLVPTFSSYIKRVLSITAATGTARAIRLCFRKALEARGLGQALAATQADE